MKKQLILTKQQQQLVEDNHKLIYFYLYRNNEYIKKATLYKVYPLSRTI